MSGKFQKVGTVKDGEIKTLETELFRYTIIRKGDRIKLLKIERKTELFKTK